MKIIGKNKYGNDWNHTRQSAGLNAWIGKLADGSVAAVQSMPWNYKPWGCGTARPGGPSCNAHWIQFEMCEDSLNNKEYFEACINEACELTAYLCKKYNINPLGKVSFSGKQVPTILCHWDSYQLGLGCGHYDIYNWINKYGVTMDDIRNRVAALMNGAASNKQEEEEEMTQEQFDKMADVYFQNLAKKPATWEQPYMDWAQKNSLYAGDGTGNLMPKAYITRGEVATVFKRFFEQLIQK